MSNNNSKWTSVAIWAILALIVIASPWWISNAKKIRGDSRAKQPVGHSHGGGHSHGAHGADDAHGHAHGGGGEALELSPVAWQNLGLETGVVELSDFVRSVSVPAIVVERPGRSQFNVTAPMTGVVTQIFPLEGESVEPGQPVFELRLTHEDVVSSQGQFLESLEELDLANVELARLKSIGEGVIPGKKIIQQEYVVTRAKARVEAQEQALLLHGLTSDQIAEIKKARGILQKFTIVAPGFTNDPDRAESVRQFFHLQSVNVNRGEHVEAGKLLGVLADHSLLYLQGKAFEEDAFRLTHAAKNKTTLKVQPLSGDDTTPLELSVLFVSDHVDETSRALKFFLLLPNEVTGSESMGGTSRFLAWKFKPGQRMQVKVPTGEHSSRQIVLPLDAVAVDGVNAYVFEQNGNHFDRIDVQILFRDKDSIVIANDGKLLGSTIAMNAAYRMYLELKNQAGGGVDPHAGHSH